ncbi:hypothetical protein XENORESO_001350, partial [Xenotaenia resolanae]
DPVTQNAVTMVVTGLAHSSVSHVYTFFSSSRTTQGCVCQTVPRGSGVTAGAVRGATPHVRAALGVEATSAFPVCLVIT